MMVVTCPGLATILYLGKWFLRMELDWREEVTTIPFVMAD
jgi:hypothetical protein